MSKRIFLVFLFMLSLLMGCTNKVNQEPTEPKDIIMKVMNENKLEGIVFSITDLENGFLAFYNNNANGTSAGIGLIYTEKQKGQWRLLKSDTSCWEDFGRNVTIGDKVAQKDQPPYFYFGTIMNGAISKVTVDGKEAEFVQFDPNKRVWYYVDDYSYNKTTKVFLKDGTELFQDM